jgi:hypothetical protein
MMNNSNPDNSRRSFLKKIAALGASIAGGAAALDFFSDEKEKNKIFLDIENDINKLEDKILMHKIANLLLKRDLEKFPTIETTANENIMSGIEWKMLAYVKEAMTKYKFNVGEYDIRREDLIRFRDSI